MKVFVNTLERFADRRSRMKGILDSLGVPFEYFEGPDGKKLRQDEIDAAYNAVQFKKLHGREMSLNELGCTMGHRAIYKKMVDEGIEKACILEDDVLLDAELPETLAFLDALNFKNTVVKLDNYREKSTPCSIWVKKRVGSRGVYKKPVTAQWMTWGYVLDRGAAESILRRWPKIEFLCDDWKRIDEAVKMRCVQPAVVHPNRAMASMLDEGRDAVIRNAERPGNSSSKIDRLLHIAKTVFLMLFS
jgi:glycosyl transferase, family 25